MDRRQDLQDYSIGVCEMKKADLLDINKFLMDLHFIQANALVAAQLNETRSAIEYMKRIALLRETIKEELEKSE